MKRSWKGETFWKLVWHQRTLFIVTLYLRKYNLLLLLLFSGHQWYISSANVIHLKPCSCCYLIYIFFVWWVSVLQRRLKMDWRKIRRFFRILKMDQRWIWRIFVNSKTFWLSSKIANSSNIFKDTKISGSYLNKLSQQ